MSEPPAALAEVLRPDFEPTVERHGPQVLDGDLRSGSRGIEKAVQLAHGFVENRGNDSAVTVPGRSSVPLAQAKSAQELRASLVQGEPQAHAVDVIAPAAEAEVRLALFA